MTEPPKDAARDKAVEAALAAIPYEVDPDFWGGSVDALNNLWQRAQEAEREENCKAVCGYCRAADDYKPARDTGETGWQHVRRRDGQDFACRASAIWAIRARAPESVE